MSPAAENDILLEIRLVPRNQHDSIDYFMARAKRMEDGIRQGVQVTRQSAFIRQLLL
jgi:hypothetical protein